METKNAELIQGLRDLLAFVEANQDFEFNPVVGMSNVELKAGMWYIHDDERQRIFIADLTRRMAHVGKVEKLYGDDFAWIRLAFGAHVKFEIATMRKTICERVVVGKKLIPAQPERTIAATPETTVEEVEWRCHPVMSAGSSHTVEGEAPELEGSEPLQLASVTDDIPF